MLKNKTKIVATIGPASSPKEVLKKMIEEGRYCPEIIMQLRAVGSACQSIETTMLQKHLESCVMEAFYSKDKDAQAEKIQELTNLYKR